jgi:hypothetical protein
MYRVSSQQAYRDTINQQETVSCCVGPETLLWKVIRHDGRHSLLRQS